MFGWQDALIAGAGVSLIAILRNVPKKLLDIFVYHYTRKITLYDDDPGFNQLCEWMVTRIKSPKSFRLNWVGDNIISSPGLGLHYFRLDGVWVTIRRDVENEKMRPRECVRITFWAKSCDPMATLLQILKQDMDFKVHIANGGWFSSYSRPKRPLSTVHSEWKDYLLKECKDFFKKRAWYIENGIPWRKAFLLHGPPRNGKTSTIHAIASELNLQVYMINPKTMADDSFIRSINRVPPKSIILLEDLKASEPEKDAESEEDKPQVAKQPCGVSESTLLNSLDGLAAPDGVIIFGTSNLYAGLSQALKERFEPLEFPELDSSKLTEDQLEVLAAGQNHYGGKLKKAS